MKSIHETSKKDRLSGQIMEINVNSTNLVEVLTRVETLMSHNMSKSGNNSKFYIVTPNPELILASISDESLKKALNEATISVPDGVGLKIADPKLQIIKGRELFAELINLAVRKKWKVFLLGGLENEAELSTRNLVKKFPDLQIKYNAGPMLDREARPLSPRDIKLEKEVRDQINEFKPQLLFVAYGNPRQEIWINENIEKLDIGGAMAVGGTLRYEAGLSKLPPGIVSVAGFEWFWRLLTEPKRIKRIFNAVFVFPVKYFIYKLSQ